MGSSRLKTRMPRFPWLVASYQAMWHLLGIRRIQQFSIALFHGQEPWSLGPIPGRWDPVLTAGDVHDVPAAFVADPFLIRHQDLWFMFFEVMRADTWRGEIAVATSPDAVTWTYRGIVLAEPHHLSYPHVFAWDGHVYMVPETFEAGSVRLYRATAFPFEWTCEHVLLEGACFADASVFRHHGRWWMLVEASAASAASGRKPRHDTLRLFGASALAGPWIEHPASPVVQRDARFARPAGRVVSSNGHLVRFAQECVADYGVQVHAFRIEELSPQRYRERRISDRPVVGPGLQRWHRGGMHHVDAHPVEDGWLAAVDGWSRRTVPTARSAQRPLGQRRVWALDLLR